MNSQLMHLLSCHFANTIKLLNRQFFNELFSIFGLYQEQTIGDEAFPHKSEILLYAVRCEDRSLAFEQWTMTAGEIGTGATVWAGQIDQPSLYKDPNDPTFVSMMASVCNG